MKSILFIFCAVFFFQKTTGQNQEKDDSIYTIILQEIKGIDTAEYYISVEITEKYPISENIYKALKENSALTAADLKNLKRKIIYDYEKDLSSGIMKIIDLSKANFTNKTKLKYLFSLPFKMGKDKILVFNSVYYKPAKDVIKGGVERVFVFQKRNCVWKLQKEIPLLDF